LKFDTGKTAGPDQANLVFRPAMRCDRETVNMRSRFILLVALALAGCAAGPQQASRTVMSGVDVWTSGAPSQPYDVMATVQRVGPDSSVTYAQLEASIADEASQRGADGVIIVSQVMVPSRTSLFTARQIMAPKVVAELIKYR
jgi:hypothetical protein